MPTGVLVSKVRDTHPRAALGRCKPSGLARGLLLSSVIWLTACAAGPGGQAPLPVSDLAPEAATGRQRHALAQGQRHMVVAAHPLATQAGLDTLRAGGSAADAAIAAQWVLSLVEPQSSGLGGGGFLLYFDAATQRTVAYDGREQAPSAARPDRFLTTAQDAQAAAPMAFRDAVNSGLSVGVPGLVALMAHVHRQHGRLPWAALLEPAIRLAETGFEVGPRLHGLLSIDEALPRQPAAAAYFYDAQGRPWPVGHRLRNPDLARTFRQLARSGPDAFYTGDLARHMVAAVRDHEQPGDLSLADLAAYRVIERDPLCGSYRQYRVCGMPPPSSGGLAVLQWLGIYQRLPAHDARPMTLPAEHYFAEAGRLTFADRNHYVADPAYVTWTRPASSAHRTSPSTHQTVDGARLLAALLAPDYLQARAALVRPDASLGTALPGQPLPGLRPGAHGMAPDLPATTHLSVVDEQGNAVALTSSVESAFGSKIFVGGFLLNNQMTDFSLSPTDTQGRPAINRIEPGKRPRSSMAPTLVFDDAGLRLVAGSPGGSAIISYVARFLFARLDGGLDIQQAVELPHAGSRNGPTELERGTDAVRLAPALRALGHEVRLLDFTSGLHVIERTPQGWLGAADPRREGRAMGD